MLEKIKKSGWFEPEKNQQGKSPKHQEVSIKTKYQDTMRTPITSPMMPEKEKEYALIECPRGHRLEFLTSDLDDTVVTIECDKCKETYHASEWKGIKELDEEDD